MNNVPLRRQGLTGHLRPCLPSVLSFSTRTELSNWCRTGAVLLRLWSGTTSKPKVLQQVRYPDGHRICDPLS